MLGQSLGSVARSLNFWCVLFWSSRHAPPHSLTLIRSHRLPTRTLRLAGRGRPPILQISTKEKKLGVASLKGLIASMAQSSALPAPSLACPLLSPLLSLLSQLASGLRPGLWPDAPLPNRVEPTAAQPWFGMKSPEPTLHGTEQEHFSCKCAAKKAVYPCPWPTRLEVHG